MTPGGINAIIDAATTLAVLGGMIAMIGIIAPKNIDRLKKMERAWIERVCIGGPME